MWAPAATLCPPPIARVLLRYDVQRCSKVNTHCEKFRGALAESLIPPSFALVTTMIAWSGVRLPAEDIIDEKAPVMLSCIWFSPRIAQIILNFWIASGDFVSHSM